MSDDIRRTIRCVKHYRKIGLCPLPSRQDVKGPMLASYASHYGDTPVAESIYDDWWTTNIQIITGTKSPTPNKIVVVDCDSERAVEVWNSMCRTNRYKPEDIWIARTGSGGYHFYFSIPPSEVSCAAGLIWGIWDTWGEDGRGRWLPHQEVRLLADRSLVIAPPSIHVSTGERYAFDPTANPNNVRLPAIAPRWLLDMPRLIAPRFKPDMPKIVAAPKTYKRSNGFHRRELVLDAMGDHKLVEAKSWGLVVKSDTPNPAGWVTCWVPWREDPSHSTPSGSFNLLDGTFQDRKDNTSISLFDLAVTLGKFATWQECREFLGDQYIGKRCIEYTQEYVFK